MLKGFQKGIIVSYVALQVLQIIGHATGAIAVDSDLEKMLAVDCTVMAFLGIATGILLMFLILRLGESKREKAAAEQSEKGIELDELQKKIDKNDQHKQAERIEHRQLLHSTP